MAVTGVSRGDVLAMELGDACGLLACGTCRDGHRLSTLNESQKHTAKVKAMLESLLADESEDFFSKLFGGTSWYAELCPVFRDKGDKQKREWLNSACITLERMSRDVVQADSAEMTKLCELMDIFAHANLEIRKVERLRKRTM